MSEKLIFPIGFDLEEGVKEASKEWKNTYQKQLQKAIDDKPLKVKIDFESKGIDTKEFKQWMALSREAEKLERERIKNAKEWQKVADQQAMTQTRIANATNESNARIERQNRKAEASEKRKRDAVERTNEAYKRQGGYLSRLFQRMVAYASVAQAFSFVRNVRDVTAEFELQRVALGSIIGDLNEANAMFEQIKAAAVKSPFQIKELVTYTKQLAAYKIESDELFETTQRLADISAGLGVGMERLVLAYGQIRATGYLRASEVRQLTEAGIPIVEELAKKMSQLRGETVSAAEVMGMISERAISFGMVKEVFDDMTSAGGMFYKMQEKQAETLAGQWSNLQDAISIMYEEIGNTETAQNGIKGMIGLVKSLAENWRVVGGVLVSVVGSYAGLKIGASIINLLAVSTRKYRLASLNLGRAITNLRTAQQSGGAIAIWAARMQVGAARAQRQATIATNAHTAAWYRLKAAIMSNPLGAILTVLTTIISMVVSLVSEMDKLENELSKIGTEGALQADQSVRNFERLADVIKSSVNGSKQQTDAIKELKRSYGDFLPMQDEEIRKLLSTEGGYRAVSSAIREKIALQIQEQKINATTSAFGEDISDIQDDIRKRLIDEGLSRDEVSRFFAELEKAIKDGVTDIQSELPNIFKKATKLDWSFFKIRDVTTGSFGFGNIMTLIDLLTDYEEKIKDIESETQASLGAFDAYNKEYQDLQKTLSELSSDKPMLSFEWNEDMRTKQIEAYRDAVKELIEDARNYEGLSQDDYNKLIGMDNLDAVFDMLEEKVPAMANIVRKLRNEWLEMMPTSMTQSINAQIISIANTMGIPMDKVQSLLKQNSEDYATWAQRLKGVFDKSKGDVVAWRTTLNAALSFNPSAITSVQGELTNAEDWKKFMEELNKAFQFSGSGGRGGSRQKDAWVSAMEERMKYMKDFQQGVEKLSKTMSQASAIEREQMIMLNRGVALGLNPKELKGSTEELLAWYEKSINDTVAKIQKFKGFRGLTVEQILSTKTKNKTIQEYQALLQSLYNSMTDFETSQVEKEMEKKLKKLSNDISRTKTAKEFFDRMLGLTGDKELSATLTMSVYGIEKPEGELSEFFAKQLATDMQKQIQKYLPNIDISSAINEATGEIDPVKLKGIVDALDPVKAGQTNLDAVKKLIKEMIDGNAKYLESLYDSYEKFLDYEHRKTIVAEREAEERKKIAEQNIPEDEKKKLTEASEKRERTEKLKIDIEQFKAGEEYVKIFEEIENLSTMSIGRLMGALDKFMKDNAAVLAENPEQLKTLMGEYQKLYEGLITRNPFRAIVDGLKEYQSATKNVISARKELKKAEDSGDEAKIASAKTKLADALDKQQEALNKQIKGYQAASSALSNFGSIITDITEMLGITEDSKAGAFIKDLVKWLGVMATVLSTVSAILVVINTVGAPFLTIASGIAAIAASISYLANAKVRRANQDIEHQQELLDQLAYSYERLEKAQEKAFGSDYISNYEQRLANLQAQQEAYLKQADAERSKGKKADEDKIKEYEEAYREATDNIKDMQTELSEYFLGTDLTSAARDFASAWIDAYKEFGSTTDAMKEKFQDMIQNMIVESFAARVIQSALSDIFTEIDNMTKDGVLDVSEASKIADMTEVAVSNIDVGMTNLMNALSQAGLSVRGMGSELTGISRDIATASEESILGLAAGINTQNFYISQVPTKLDTIIGLLRGENAMQGSAITLQDLVTIQNQHLSHLPNIAQHTADTVAECKQIVAETRRTADALERVIKPRGTISTHSMNVTIGS